MAWFSWRRFAAVLLVVLVLGAPTAAGATTAARRKTGTSLHTTAKKKRTVRTARARRARRPPPGGVYARSAIVLDPVTGKVLFQKNADRAAPIASLTKLMTAMVFLEQKPDLARAVEITREELHGGGHTQLRNGEKVALGDLLHMSLMCSDNVATRVLARESGLDKWDFLARMNRKAGDLQLADTRFVEFTGLDQGNVSTASDVAVLLRAAAANDLIHSITTTTSYEFSSDRRAHLIGNTNRLLHSRYQILGGKTGFISQAGYCFATWIRTDGQDLIAVVLGAPTNATRFADVVRLVQKATAPGAAATKS
jgi:D-alanyl-D-alanine endopeptidase (penicillin-binding protein 7)